MRSPAKRCWCPYTAIWEQLDGKKRLKDIRDGVLDTFDVKKEQAETDIFEFIDELVKADLVVQST